MKNFLIILSAGLLFFSSMQLNAAPVSEKAPKKPGPRFTAAVYLGAVFYGIVGPSAASYQKYRIRYSGDSFKAGFTGGLDGIFLPAPRHALSLGVFYEQRIITAKTTSVLYFPFFTDITFNTLFSLPVERLTQELEFAADYVTFPLAYRVQFGRGIYFGIGLDAALLVHAQVHYKLFVVDTSSDLKKFLYPVDFGGKIIGGINIKGFLLELQLGCSILDFDRPPGIRRSIYLRFFAGYRL